MLGRLCFQCPNHRGQVCIAPKRTRSCERRNRQDQTSLEGRGPSPAGGQRRLASTHIENGRRGFNDMQKHSRTSLSKAAELFSYTITTRINTGICVCKVKGDAWERSCDCTAPAVSRRV